MPKVDVRDQREVDEYNDYVHQSKYGQITQDSRWGQVKNNWETKYIYLKEENKMIAAASIYIGVGLYNKKFAYCIKGPVMDMSNIGVFKRLVQECKQYLPEDVYLLKFDPEMIYDEAYNKELLDEGFYTFNKNIQKFGMHSTIQPRLNMVIDFDKFEERPTSVYDIVPSKIKNKLKKAKKDGVAVTYGLDETFLDEFYQSYKSMSIRHEISHRPKEYFQHMFKAFKNTEFMRIYVAKKDNQLLSSGIAFNCGEKIWYMYAGSMPGKIFNAPYAVQEQMIQWAIDSGSSKYDMGGIENTSEDDGLFTFKRNFVRQQVSEYIGEIDTVLIPDVYKKVIEEKFGFIKQISSSVIRS